METYNLKPGTRGVKVTIDLRDSLEPYSVYADVYEAVLKAADEARLAGAPGHARISFWYDPQYLVDQVIIDWPVPVLGSEPLPERPRPSHYPSPLPLRLGNVPQ